MLEKLVFVGGTLIAALAIGYAGDAAVDAQPAPAEAPPVVALTADGWAKRLASLERRLAHAREDIATLMQQLGTVDDARVAATRTRLATLYRLETGLVADIERTQAALAIAR